MEMTTYSYAQKYIYFTTGLLFCQQHTLKEQVIYKNQYYLDNRSDQFQQLQNTKYNPYLNKDTMKPSVHIDYSDDSCHSSIHFGSDQEQSEQESGRNNSETAMNQQMSIKKKLQYRGTHHQASKRKKDKTITTAQAKKSTDKSLSLKCGCGKYYSSFPSLFEHIQTIHNGVCPEDTSVETNKIAQIPNLQEGFTLQNQQFKTYFRQYEKLDYQRQSPQQNSTSYIQQKQDYAEHQTFKSETKEDTQRVACESCGRTYNCKSALNKHIRDDHPQIGLKARPYHRVKLEPQQCAICGHTVNSLIALENHVAICHQARFDGGVNEAPPPFDENICEIYSQRCGCGNVYKSRVALYMHVKNKHGGIQPIQGQKTKDTKEHQKTQRSGSEERQSSYDSDDYQFQINDRKASENHQKQGQQSQQELQSPPRNRAGRRRRRPELPRPFQCGCGNGFISSAGLNYHIKKYHNWMAPPGTVSGPRGYQKVETLNINEIIKKGQSVICSECEQPLSQSYYVCKHCLNHLICSNCFKATDNSSQEHEWIHYDQ